jgi:hypothetical protein
VEPSEELPFYDPNAWNRPLVDTGAEQPLTFGDTVRVRATERQDGGLKPYSGSSYQ